MLDTVMMLDTDALDSMIRHVLEEYRNTDAGVRPGCAAERRNLDRILGRVFGSDVMADDYFTTEQKKALLMVLRDAGCEKLAAFVHYLDYEIQQLVKQANKLEHKARKSDTHYRVSQSHAALQDQLLHVSTAVLGRYELANQRARYELEAMEILDELFPLHVNSTLENWALAFLERHFGAPGPKFPVFKVELGLELLLHCNLDPSVRDNRRKDDYKEDKLTGGSLNRSKEKPDRLQLKLEQKNGVYALYWL